MPITKFQLKQIIKEEIQAVLSEQTPRGRSGAGRLPRLGPTARQSEEFAAETTTQAAARADLDDLMTKLMNIFKGLKGPELISFIKGLRSSGYPITNIHNIQVDIETKLNEYFWKYEKWVKLESIRPGDVRQLQKLVARLEKRYIAFLQKLNDIKAQGFGPSGLAWLGDYGSLDPAQEAWADLIPRYRAIIQKIINKHSENKKVVRLANQAMARLKPGVRPEGQDPGWADFDSVEVILAEIYALLGAKGKSKGKRAGRRGKGKLYQRGCSVLTQRYGTDGHKCAGPGSVKGGLIKGLYQYFYKELEKYNLLKLLGRSGPDKKWGKRHQKAFDALQKAAPLGDESAAGTERKILPPEYIPRNEREDAIPQKALSLVLTPLFKKYMSIYSTAHEKNNLARKRRTASFVAKEYVKGVRRRGGRARYSRELQNYILSMMEDNLEEYEATGGKLPSYGID